ncbi:AraC family transcriptional regulator [Archangium minus]|uniref:AraC family transcriptional regulator n=2 Tax=Archangium minus TaxID=83450 RepID=A0ABY9X703_9BACT|nr:AraC family transcriptional regulator [Archangium minus]
MHRTTKRPPPPVLTLDGLGARGMPLYVNRRSDPSYPTPLEPVIYTFFAILLFTEGTGRGRHLEELELQAGDIHLLPPGIPHHAIDAKNLRGWLVAFDPTLLRLLGQEHWPGQPRITGEPRPEPLRSLFIRGLFRLRPEPPRLRRIQHFISELDTELRQSRWGAEGAARSFFTLLITELIREMQEHAPLVPPLLGGLVRDALTFVETHCLEPISLQEVAAAVGRTPAYVANAVRRETGLTVGDWLREHRMSEARRQLLETAASVERIASQVGYADVTHFIRTFRRAHGMTPRVWREQHRRAPI